MQIYELPENGQVLLAHPSQWEQARIAGDTVGLDWFLSELAPASHIYWLRLDPVLMRALPIIEIPQASAESKDLKVPSPGPPSLQKLMKSSFEG